MTKQDDNPLGNFLKDRRTKLDAASLGYPMTRRRTPGLRREEVAQRANVSTTWYTWLEQGRGGAPSTDVLDRLARGLSLTEAEREHLFLLAQNRLPEVQYQETSVVTAQLQRVLDSLEFSPAYIRNSEWDVVAWNQAARALLGDFGKLPDGRRNILQMLFREPEIKTRFPNWELVARAIVAVFRSETARTGASLHTKAFVDELSLSCPEFKKLWGEHDVSTGKEGSKAIEHPTAGAITLEFSTFAVDGMPNLSLVIFNPATPKDKASVRLLMDTFGDSAAGI